MSKSQSRRQSLTGGDKGGERKGEEKEEGNSLNDRLLAVAALLGRFTHVHILCTNTHGISMYPLIGCCSCLEILIKKHKRIFVFINDKFVSFYM
jgi:hypothetical protein